MRNILFNWILEVHEKFQLQTRTLFLTVNIFDRYLEHNQIKKNQLQKVGIACLVIASKFEDIFPPEFAQMSFLCENSYSRQEIITMEEEIIYKLNFNLIFVSSYDFLQIFWEKLDIKNDSWKSLSELILKFWLFAKHSGEWDARKLAQFSLNFAHYLLFSKDMDWQKGVCYNQEDQQRFLGYLSKMIKYLRYDELTALNFQYKGLYSKLIYSPLLSN